MLKQTTVKTNIPIIYLKEGRSYICYSPVFDLVAHGDSFEDAKQSFSHTLKLFVEQVSKKGTWAEVLREYGWGKVRREWNFPRIIGQENKEIKILVAV